MIHDFIIIKDGLPILVKNFSNPSNIFCNGDSLIMISGFFTALNSFSDSFEDLGTISELKLSNNELKLSFLKDNGIPNLIYLATYDETSKAVNVQRVLRKISKTFLKKYNINQILNWNGRRNAFKTFDEILENYQYEEIEENDLNFKERVMDLFKNVEEKLNEESNLIALREGNRVSREIPGYCIQVPKSVSSLNINPKHYLTGEVSYKVFNRINGESSIESISEELNISHKQVYNICKNLIKLGFITLN
ncbi:MAG: hypothetical protein KGD73_05480 [Candidatus Lokiarchaeota archaeon]|nr:hypothetical protein [Candidatus Lokiarchaeota archaeon]